VLWDESRLSGLGHPRPFEDPAAGRPREAVQPQGGDGISTESGDRSSRQLDRHFGGTRVSVGESSAVCYARAMDSGMADLPEAGEKSNKTEDITN
jgi:hypothetical protein